MRFGSGPRLLAFLRRRWASLATAAALALFLFANSGFRNLLENYRELRRIQGELQSLAREEESIRRRLYLIEHEDSYLERMARRELGYVRPGELEYRFPPPSKNGVSP